MWRSPLPLFGGGGDISVVIDSDTYIGDLFVWLGSPTGIRAVQITADAADVGEIWIPTDFAVGSTFEFIGINGGRFLGEGGNGGGGGADFGSTGEAGAPGSDGRPAIQNFGTYPVSIDVDDGFLFGGGGGGGGGAYTDTGTGGDAGGGGGGGQGWSGGALGLGGNSIGLPPAEDGTAGTRLTAGAGGDGGGLSPVNGAGGGGGTWGLGGRSGRTSDLLSGVGFGASFFYYGGLGGQAGAAYQGGNLTLSGVETEATLRAQGRILGEIGPDYITVPSFSLNYWSGEVGIPYNGNAGINFLSTGATLEIDTNSSPTASTVYYLTGGSGTGADYQVRIRGLSGDREGTISTSAAADGTWVQININRQWFNNFTGTGRWAALFELRRNDIPSVGADDVMASFFVKSVYEAEP